MRPFDFSDTIKASPVLVGCVGGDLGLLGELFHILMEDSLLLLMSSATLSA